MFDFWESNNFFKNNKTLIINIYIYIFYNIGDVKICESNKTDVASSHKVNKKSNTLVI